MKTYKASMDSLGKIVTISVLVIVIVMAALSSGYALLSPIETEKQASVLVTVAVVAIFVLTWLLAPRAYHLTPDELIIDRPLRSVKIPLYEIEKVTQHSMSEFTYMLRLFGSGGFLGYFGLFWAAKIGRMWWYATQRRNLIMIHLPNSNPIVISPDDVTLAQELQKWAKG